MSLFFKVYLFLVIILPFAKCYVWISKSPLVPTMAKKQVFRCEANDEDLSEENLKSDEIDSLKDKIAQALGNMESVQEEIKNIEESKLYLF